MNYFLVIIAFAFFAFSKPPSIEENMQNLINLKSKRENFIPVLFSDSMRLTPWPGRIRYSSRKELCYLAEIRFNQYCSLKEWENEKPAQIPKSIHLIWIGSQPPIKVLLACESWKNHHPDFTLKLWTDEDIENFVWTHPKSENFFLKARNWAEKSDILRFEILYQFGGIYSDTDVVCMNSFNSLIDCGLTFFAGFETHITTTRSHSLIGSAIIGAMQNSPIIRRCIDFSETEEEAPNKLQFIRSGPGPITQASHEALMNMEENILLLPTSYFYPVPIIKKSVSTEEIIGMVREETLSVHLWEYSWQGSK